MHDSTRTANLLGATALAVTDLMLAGATAAAGTSSSGAAALVILSTSPGLSVTELGRRVGLSQPAAARMVDSLERHGVVRRAPSIGRWVTVHLTDAGQQAARQLLAARGGQLTAAVDVLDGDDRATLDDLLGKLLDGLYAQIGNARRMCRLCDVTACVESGEVCPVGQAEREDDGPWP